MVQIHSDICVEGEEGLRRNGGRKERRDEIGGSKEKEGE